MATNSMTGSSHDSMANTSMEDSSITNSEISNISETAMSNNSMENEEHESFKSAVQFEKQVDEPPVVQPNKSSKHSKYMCGMCIKYFEKRSQLKTHLSRYHDGTDSNLCSICGWLNTREVDISGHMRSVHPLYKQCDQCQKWLYSKRRLNVHMVQFHAPATERIQCHFCSSSFIRQKTLATHMLKFHMLLQCLECVEYFTEDEDLDVHQRKCHSKAGRKRKQSRATQNQVNECLVTSTSQENDDVGQDICSSPESLSETSLIDESVNCHDSDTVISDRIDNDDTESNTVSCKDIQSIQKLTSLRDRHLEVSLCLQDKVDTNESHSMDNMKKSKVEISQSGLHCPSNKLNQAKDMISCKYCDLKLSCRASFSNHMILIHEACECEYCNGWFENKKILLDHSRICNRSKLSYGTNAKDCNVNDCNSAFPICQAQQTAFEDPTEESLAPVASFTCSVCNMMFTTIESLSDHGNSCQRSFECSICDEMLQNEAALSDHVQFVHRVGKNYNCSLCERLFLKASSLKRHLTATHGDSKVEKQVIKLPKRKYMHRCCLCRKVFSQYSYLKMHLRLHVKEKQPKRGGRVTGRVVTEDINNFGVSYSCTDESRKIPVESVTANCGKSRTAREESPSFNTDNQMRKDKADNLVGWDSSGRVKGSGGCDGGRVLKDVDMASDADTQCHEGGSQQMENVNCENIVHRNTDTQSKVHHSMDIGTNSMSLANSVNNSQVGKWKMNTINAMGNGNRRYVGNPLDVTMAKNVNDTEADSAVDVNSIIASLVESLPVDQCSNDMETSSAVQSILDIPVIEQSHHLHHTEHTFTAPSEDINCSHRQGLRFINEESRNKDNSEVCQQSETLALEQLCEDNHVSKDHSYMMTRHPPDVLSEYPSDLNTNDPSDVISENPSDIISTDLCGFRTAGQSSSHIMASNDRSKTSPIVLSREEIKGSDKEDNNSCVNSTNCSDEKDHSVCNEDSSSSGEDNSINGSDNSCDADCSEDNPSNSSSDKTRESHNFESFQEGKDMDADQELELPHVETGACTFTK
ncbi:zinc finger protein 26-like [Haliotis rubra]|uniref:zinc finger protein 26-like n=1 Tax=Haliotis rubra TaxID=36100 RepID=UPI001EE6262F|nr:zinc finger protein 26-like [Haliotis rubra]XP_046556054.1 zinc finger protein 26-like [Haliotis rubra]